MPTFLRRVLLFATAHVAQHKCASCLRSPTGAGKCRLQAATFSENQTPEKFSSSRHGCPARPAKIPQRPPTGGKKRPIDIAPSHNFPNSSRNYFYVLRKSLPETCRETGRSHVESVCKPRLVADRVLARGTVAPARPRALAHRRRGWIFKQPSKSPAVLPTPSWSGRGLDRLGRAGEMRGHGDDAGILDFAR